MCSVIGSWMLVVVKFSFACCILERECHMRAYVVTRPPAPGVVCSNAAPVVHVASFSIPVSIFLKRGVRLVRVHILEEDDLRC